MIVVLLFLSLTWWGYWLLFRGARSPRATPAAAPAKHVTPTTAVLGLEDDPDQWRVTRNAWTALDECQLIRLLTAAAPVSRPATNSVDNTIPPSEQKDIL